LNKKIFETNELDENLVCAKIAHAASEVKKHKI